MGPGLRRAAETGMTPQRCGSLHRRLGAVLADGHRTRGHQAVGRLPHDHEHRRADLHQLARAAARSAPPARWPAPRCGAGRRSRRRRARGSPSCRPPRCPPCRWSSSSRASGPSRSGPRPSSRRAGRRGLRGSALALALGHLGGADEAAGLDGVDGHRLHHRHRPGRRQVDHLRRPCRASRSSRCRRAR